MFINVESNFLSKLTKKTLGQDLLKGDYLNTKDRAFLVLEDFNRNTDNNIHILNLDLEELKTNDRIILDSSKILYIPYKSISKLTNLNELKKASETKKEFCISDVVKTLVDELDWYNIEYSI